MAIHTFGTNSSSSLSAVQWSPPPGGLAEADLNAISQAITDDAYFGSILQGGNPATIGILATSATHSNTTLDTLVSTAGPPLSAIQVGMLVLGVGIPPGTFVAAILSGTSVQLSQAATTTATPRVGFISSADNFPRFDRTGRVWVPQRGVLQLWPNDVVAVDNCGAVIIVPNNSVTYAGSVWSFV